MEAVRSKLTVLFEEPFWIGIYERREGRTLEVCKIIFGAEPRDYEVYAYLKQHFSDLRFSPKLRVEKEKEKPENTKRKQRQIKRIMQEKGVATKSQEALKLQQQEYKTARKQNRKKKSEEEKRYQFELKQKKKKQKHKGK